MRKRVSVIAIALIMLLAVITVVPGISAPGDWQVANNFSVLSSLLQDATTTNIMLGANITIPSGGVEINPVKTSLVIDGAGQYSLSDSASSSNTDTMRLLRDGNLKDITLQNMSINGHNYFGIVFIDPQVEDVSLTFDGITYVGPELADNKYGSVHLIDCDITITEGSSHAGRVAEAVDIILEGNVNISKNVPGSYEEIFWLNGSCEDAGAILVKAGARVNIVSNQDPVHNDKKAGFVYVNYNNSSLIFEDNSYFSFEGNTAFQEGDTFAEVQLGQNAEVYIKVKGEYNCNEPLMYIRDLLEIQTDSVFHLVGLSNQGNQPSPTLRMTEESIILINDPKHVVISNLSSYNVAPAIGLDGTAYMQLSANSIQNWTTTPFDYATMGSPDIDYRNAAGTTFVLDATFMADGNPSALMTAGYNGSTPLVAPSDFSLQSARTFAINGIMDEATIHIEHRDADDDTLLDAETHILPSGAYGPYAPITIPGYDFKEHLGTSAPVSGTINPGETKTIVFLYDKRPMSDISGEVIWQDQNKRNNLRPDEVTIVLYADGVQVDTRIASEAGGWTYSFTGLPELSPGGTPYVYTVAQQDVLDGYDTTVSGYDITNRLRMYTITVRHYEVTRDFLISQNPPMFAYHGDSPTIYAISYVGRIVQPPSSFTFNFITQNETYTFYYDYIL